MFRARRWLSSLIVLAVMAVPMMAGNNEAKTANDNAANASAEASPSPAPSPAPSPSPSVNVSTAASDANVTALLGVLVQKGVLAPSEANAIKAATPGTEFQLLVEALSRKGVLNAADLSAAMKPVPSSAAAPEAEVSSSLSTSDSDTDAQTPQVATTQQTPQREKPLPAGVVPAVAPVRVIALDPPKKDGLAAAFKMGPVKMTPYGFIKATAVNDSSAPDGDDFPFIGLFLNSTNATNTGPTKDPEFHIKARSTRIGANIEWPDPSPKLTFTGRIEADYEGMFSTVDNRDITSIRNPSMQMRLAYVRMDYAANDRTDVFFEGGQDWSLYGSTALPNLLETTFLGAYYGDSYTRSPQFMLGAVQKIGNSPWNFKVAPTVAIMMPSTGEIEKLCSYGAIGGNATCLAGYENQLGQGERQGADADQPEFEAKLAFGFQLDKAPGVAPAQIFWSGFHSKRKSIVANSSYQCDDGDNPLACSEEAAFPNGFQTTSKQYGNQIAIQLPTRWFTFVASGYKGGDLRFFTAGQVSAFGDDVGGLNGVTSGYLPLDGVVNAAGAPALACNVALVEGVCPSSANAVIVPQRPIRAFGGFLNVGLPISRWFNADPKGHNAGWQLFLNVGKDQVVNRDINHFNGIGCGAADGSALCSGALPLLMGKMFAATLYYKVNPWCTFAIEQSNYATRFFDHANAYTIAGKPSNEWQDNRTEFGPVFTF
ncbi:MAG: hypothetical protein ACLPHI_08415 [Terriglobales bacterium]